jgi:hypothetical protein
MSSAARARLAARVSGDYALGGHRTVFVPDLNDVAAVGNEASANGTAAAGSAAAAQAALATALTITGGVQGIGAAPLDVTRALDLADSAFMCADMLRGRWPAARGAAYQIVPTDYGRTLIAETGTLTWTLPLLSLLPPGWWFSVWNRSGANLTISRGGSDVIGAAATSLTVADGAGVTIAYRDGTRFERIA